MVSSCNALSNTAYHCGCLLNSIFSFLLGVDANFLHIKPAPSHGFPLCLMEHSKWQILRVLYMLLPVLSVCQ